ncbi:hypothetical protein [Pseudomonas sp. NPDC099000]|uniref:hypothetical protein n=1 Tax=Pseudomonas sp. NPDC099000 TaxID=3364488 RepID=UPI00383B2756
MDTLIHIYDRAGLFQSSLSDLGGHLVDAREILPHCLQRGRSYPSDPCGSSVWRLAVSREGEHRGTWVAKKGSGFNEHQYSHAAQLKISRVIRI